MRLTNIYELVTTSLLLFGDHNTIHIKEFRMADPNPKDFYSYPFILRTGSEDIGDYHYWGFKETNETDSSL